MGQEKFGIADKSLTKGVGLFGGGVARSGNTCGALLGGIVAISSKYGRGSLEEKENPAMWDMGSQFVLRFEELTEQYGGICCSDIARVDWTDPVAAKDFRTNPESRRKICKEVVGEAAQALGELIEKGAPQ